MVQEVNNMYVYRYVCMAVHVYVGGIIRYILVVFLTKGIPFISKVFGLLDSNVSR